MHRLIRQRGIRTLRVVNSRVQQVRLVGVDNPQHHPVRFVHLLQQQLEVLPVQHHYIHLLLIVQHLIKCQMPDQFIHLHGLVNSADPHFYKFVFLFHFQILINRYLLYVCT